MKNNIIRIFALVLCVALLSACRSNVETSQIEVALSETSMTVKLGDSGELSVLNYAGDVRWSSSDDNVVTVSSAGVVQAVSIGSAAVTANLDNGETKTCVVDVQPGDSNVEKIVVTGMYSDTSDITVNYENSSSVSLKATCTPFSPSEKLFWSSSDEMLATVDSNGVVMVCGNGTVEIKATALNGVEGSCIVRIKNVPASAQRVVMPTSDDEVPVIEDGENTGRFTSPVPVTSPSAKTSVIVSDKNVYLNVGESFTLTYAVGNTDNREIEWVSSDKAVAIVKDGRILAIGEGRAVISAVTYDGAVASCSVAVGEKEIKAMKKEVSDSKR